MTNLTTAATTVPAWAWLLAAAALFTLFMLT